MSGPRGKAPDGEGAGERLQKVLARAGVASRRRVEEMIREGLITVNGAQAQLGQRVDLAVDAVKVDGRRVFERAGVRRYLLLNKPVGVMSTRKDPEGRTTVIDLLPPRLRKGLAPVGRLDYETEGLLILTDDGELAQRVAHPRHGCLKTYEAKVKGRPLDSDIERLRQGVMLYGKRATPISIEALPAHKGARGSVSNSWWAVKLGEGRTRQIREMFFRIGHPVNRLRRVAIGPITDSQLPPGGWRELTAREVELLRQPPETPKKRPARRRATRPEAPEATPARVRPSKPRTTRSAPGQAGPSSTGKGKTSRAGRASAKPKSGPPRSGKPRRGPAGGGTSPDRGPRKGGKRG